MFSAAIAVTLAQPAPNVPQPAPNVPQPAPTGQQLAYLAVDQTSAPVQVAQNAVPSAMVPSAVATTPQVSGPASAPNTTPPADGTIAASPAAPDPAPPATTAAPAAATPTTPAGTTPPATSEIVVSGERGLKKIDPAIQFNKTSYAVMQKADDVFVAPAMHIYRDVLPKPVRTGLHNFFFNLTEPVNALNYMLQLHPGKALKTVARFGINTTIGIGGLIDVAKKKPFNLHYRPNGFANTLGYWGIGPGPYFFLPLVGPTTLRDLVGTLLGQAALPAFLGGPFKSRYYVAGAGIITALDYRVIVDDDLAKVRKTQSPYSTYRQAYLKTRYEEIEALHGRGPLAKGEEGEAPFAKPLAADGSLAPEVDVPAPGDAVALPAPALSTAEAGGPVAQSTAGAPSTAAPTPIAAPAPVFIGNPVIQKLPPNYRLHHNHP
ncbi:MlaA family lipoprotein [Novosphingobium sp.]|uniref:MlaA family lipoprotein n=1 Tax=Novosphingobium sp. TaxID=1874826 RepID=UPI003B53004C